MPVSEPTSVAVGNGVKTQEHLVARLSVKPEMGGCLLTCKICGLRRLRRPCVLLLQKGVKDAGQAKATNLNLSQGHQLYLKNTLHDSLSTLPKDLLKCLMMTIFFLNTESLT